MPDGEIDLVEEILGADAGPAAGRPDAAAAATPNPIAPERARWLADPAARIGAGAGLLRRVLRFGDSAKPVLAFAAGMIGALVLFVAAALAVSAAYTNRALPGVHVGSVDVSGLNREEVIAKLEKAYTYLGQGEVEITTPGGTGSLAYDQLGRTPDVEFMADQALLVGRSGNPIADAFSALRAAGGGQNVPVAIKIDPTAVAHGVRQLTLSSLLPSRDAEATLFYGKFIYWSSAQGSVIDEDAVGQAIVKHLTEPDAPARFQAGGALVTLEPRVGNGDAQVAIDTAERMVVDVTLTLSGPSAQSSAQTPAPTKTYSIPASTIRSWIVFRTDSYGKYGPALDLARVQAYISKLPGTTIVAPVEPRVVFDSSGVPVSVTGGQDGLGIDSLASAQAIAAYLNRLAAGGSQEGTVALVTGPVAPRITVGNLTGLKIIGQWETVFYPGETNGNGANIRVPAQLLNGQIVAPGQQFSFMRAMGPIDEAHGFTWGGVILHGVSDHTGAMGGGICSASTTMFNAAVRAGLRIDERHAHAYYIERYPVGLDATVFSNGRSVSDLRWTNDTPNPIVIRSWTAGRSKSTMTVQLWSLPLDRTVTFNTAVKSNVVPAGDYTVYVSWLAPGEKNRAEYPTAGFDTVRTRTVTDSAGNVIHFDTWKSHYRKVDGRLEIGASAPTPTPEPTPTAVFFVPLALLQAAAVLRQKREA